MASGRRFPRSGLKAQRAIAAASTSARRAIVRYAGGRESVPGRSQRGRSETSAWPRPGVRTHEDDFDAFARTATCATVRHGGRDARAKDRDVLITSCTIFPARARWKRTCCSVTTRSRVTFATDRHVGPTTERRIPQSNLPSTRADDDHARKAVIVRGARLKRYNAQLSDHDG